MEKIELNNLSFQYPDTKEYALNNVNLTFNKGEFIVITGESGSGKTTLLKCLDRLVCPLGDKSGSVEYDGKDENQCDDAYIVKKLGFVNQNDRFQQVSDTVDGELAFGNENLGLSREKIFKLSAEASCFFELSSLLGRETDTLSGGEQKKVNLASVVAMQPDFLILDEPFTKLDPIASRKFADILHTLNSMYDIAVVLSEHNLEYCFEYADRICYLDKGEVSFEGKPCDCLFEETDKKYSVLPDFAKIYHKYFPQEKLPLSIKETKHKLREKENFFIDHTKKKRKEVTEKPIVELKEICFSYEKKGKKILNNLDFALPRGSVTSLFGANGSGKSTLLKIISGVKKPTDGKIFYDGKSNNKQNIKVSLLPAEMLDILIGQTVFEDLKNVGNEDEVRRIAEKLKITDILNRHPFDLSGGQMQRCAIAKILLTSPSVLLLDEPTKGLDGNAKNDLIKILKDLNIAGMTILIVTHDVPFAYSVSDFGCMMFMGDVSVPTPIDDFVDDNLFMTTDYSLLARQERKGKKNDE